MDEHAKLREVRVELGDAHTAGALFEPICHLFAEVFSQPPANLGPEDFASQRAYFSSMRERGTFGMAVGMADGELIGFAYGYTLPPDTRWWDGLLDPLPDETTQEWQGRTFALVDFAVKEGWRGKGLGRRLHDALLDSRTEERATVATEPAATDTQGIYATWGWQKVGRLQGPSTDSLAVLRHLHPADRVIYQAVGDELLVQCLNWLGVLPWLQGVQRFPHLADQPR